MRGRSFVVVACCVSLFSVASQPAAVASSHYPTGEEIDRAKRHEQEKQEKIAEINALLDDLESRTALAGEQAITKNSEYAQSQEALSESELRLQEREKQVSEANAKKAEAEGNVKKLVAQQYKIRGGLPITAYDLFTSSLEDSQDMAMEQYLLDRRQRAFEAHGQAHSVLKTLTDQQRSVKEEYENLTRQAQESRSSALEAHQKAEEQVAAAKKQQQLLLEQLAVLKNTSAEREAAYRRGEQERKAYQEQQQAAQDRVSQGGPDPWHPPRDKGTGGNTAPPGEGEQPPPPITPPTGDNSPGAAKAYAKNALGSYGWSPDQFGCLLSLWERESNWRVDAMNGYSGAYGIPQALPGSKMASAGIDWRTSAATQIRWGLGYIKDRYGSPCAAWEHSQLVGWY